MRQLALVKWATDDGIADALQAELQQLGVDVRPFIFDAEIPADCHVVLSFAPYGTLMPLYTQLAQCTTERRPLWAHINFEGIPDPRIPLGIITAIARARGLLERAKFASGWKAELARRGPFRFMGNRMHKFRYVDDYQRSYRLGILNVFFETSEIYAKYWRAFGIESVVVPWGTSPNWSIIAGQNAPSVRDIDVLWMGKRRTTRRSRAIDHIRSELRQLGIQMVVADGVENPFIFDSERASALQRTKIVLNLLPVPHDNNLPYRWHMAAPNGSLVISEPVQRHSTVYVPGLHYVEAPIGNIAETIKYYLKDASARKKITECARKLACEQLTLRATVIQLLQAIEHAIVQVEKSAATE